MKRLLVGGALAAVSLSVVSFPAPRLLEAQTQQTQASAPQWFSVNVVRVKPDMLTEWLEFQQKETIPALQKGGIRSRDAWTTAVFGEGFEYVFVTPISKFAAYDEQNPIQKALGEGAAAYGAKNRRMINGNHTFGIQLLSDLSIAPPASFKPTLGILTFSSVAPGRAAEYEAHVKADLLPVMRKAQVPGYIVSRTVFGGDGNEFVALRYIDKFAEIDNPPPTTRVLGAAGAAKLTAKTAGLVTHVERRITRYVPNLSFRVGTTTDAR